MNEQSSNRNEFTEIKSQAEKFYKESKSVFCPALDVEVYFTSEGFNHLGYKEFGGERPKKIQMDKFKFVKDAIKIIKKTTTIQEYRRNLRRVGNKGRDGLYKTRIVEWFCFEAVISFKKRIRIRTIVRRVGDGNFHFWSVMPSWNLSGSLRSVGLVSVEDE